MCLDTIDIVVYRNRQVANTPLRIGSADPEAEVQYCTKPRPSLSQTFGDLEARSGQHADALRFQGEHTKDAVYIDAERRFQELEKARIKIP